MTVDSQLAAARLLLLRRRRERVLVHLRGPLRQQAGEAPQPAPLTPTSALITALIRRAAHGVIEHGRCGVGQGAGPDTVAGCGGGGGVVGALGFGVRTN